MDNIRQAVERVKASQNSLSPEILQGSSDALVAARSPAQSTRARAELHTKEAVLDSTYLASRRIVSHDGADHRSRPYDILRTKSCSQ